MKKYHMLTTEEWPAGKPEIRPFSTPFSKPTLSPKTQPAPAWTAPSFQARYHGETLGWFATAEEAQDAIEVAQEREREESC